MARTMPKKLTKLEELQLKHQRIGEIHLDKNGNEYKIIEYNNNTDVLVKFTKTGGIRHTCYINIIRGYVTDPYDKTAVGIGYFGNRINTETVDKQIYKIWYGLLRRVYSEDNQKDKQYKNCKVCKEWHCFFNFQDWYSLELKKYPEEKISELRLELDKDILLKNNKIYSPEYCCLIPKKLNLVFSHACQPTGLPVGIQKSGNKYRVRCTNENGRQFLGSFETLNEAFETYKNFKEEYIKYLANYYKNLIPNNVYQAMLNYKIEIDDWRYKHDEKEK